jgi:hypothetical protein
MRWIVKFHPKNWLILVALLALALSVPSAAAATSVVVKNDGPSSVQIAFDGGQATTIAPRATARLTLDAGDHTAQCRFEGNYDGCNLDPRFTIGPANVSMSLRPVLTIQNAVALASHGALAVATRSDMSWATDALDVSGAAADCASYESGKLGAVAKRMPRGLRIRELTVAKQNLCGEEGTVIGATVNGGQVYFNPRFLIFTDGSGRPVLVR